MKELERTKRISISAVFFLLVILIGFLTFKKPEHVFQKNAESTLKELNKKEYILTMDQLKSLDASKYTLIDIRNSYEYAKGHIKNAINISAYQVFNSETKNLLNQLSTDGKTLVVYGENPDKASGAWMLLYQLGYENAKILCVTTSYTDNKFVISNYNLEKPAVNFAEVIKASSDVSKTEVKKPVKKVITVKKKKKRVAEGGC